MSGWDSLSWEAKRGAVLAQALFTCEMCHDADAIEVDHIWPKSVGGIDARWNLRAACRSCNAAKGDSLHYEDLREMPALMVQGVMHHSRIAAKALYAAAHWQAILDLVHDGTDVAEADALVTAQLTPGFHATVTDLIEGWAAQIIPAPASGAEVES